MHLIQLNTRSEDDVRLLQTYMDTANEDVKDLLAFDSKRGLAVDNGAPVQVYFVVDGQQRLTALFALVHVLQLPDVKLTIKIGGKELPKLLGGTIDEYRELSRQMAPVPSASPSSTASSRASRRIVELFKTLHENLSDLRNSVPFIQRDLKTLDICIDPSFALGAFLTLNDRGKPLTILEKFKAHCMYLDHAGTSPEPQKVHRAFGKTYHSLEHLDSPLDDDKLVQVFGLFAFIGDGRPQRESVWWGAEKWFSDKIADPKAQISTAREMLPQWLQILQEIADVNSEVTQYLVGGHPASDVSQIQPKCRKVGDDYQVAVRLRRGLSQRALAVLYKFRVQSANLHTKTETVTLQNKSIKQEIRRRLDTLIGAIARLSCDPGAQDFLDNKSKALGAQLEAIPDKEQRKLSVLELTEMIDLCSVKEASFLTSWDTAFHATGPQTLQNAMQHWAGYVESWGGRHKYLCAFLNSGETSRNSPGYALVLEYEASLGKHWPIDSNHEVEHIFANKLKEISGALPPYGFESPTDYELFYNTVGNILPLDDRLNRSLQHRDPRFKAPYYRSQTCLNGNACAPAAMSPCAYSPSAVAVGKNIQAISADPLATRYLVELRTLELTIYALMRY